MDNEYQEKITRQNHPIHNKNLNVVVWNVEMTEQSHVIYDESNKSLIRKDKNKE